AGLAQAEGTARCGSGGRDPAGLPRSAGTMKMMVRILSLLVVLVLAVAGAAAFVLYSRANEPFRGYEGEAQQLEIAPGSGTRAIGDKLVAAGIVRDAVTYRVALWLSGDARRLKAGEYRFDRLMSARDVLGK